MFVGSSWSEEFVRQIGESEIRHAYMADQVRTRIALQIRALRDQADRRWSQVELGRRAGKPQNVISRIENPDYGQLTLQTLFDIAAAFDLSLYIDFSDWVDWLGRMKDFSSISLQRYSFDLDRVVNSVQAPAPQSAAIAAAADAARRASAQRAADIIPLGSSKQVEWGARAPAEGPGVSTKQSQIDLDRLASLRDAA